MGVIATQGKYPGDWLKFEQVNLFSREEVTVASGQKLVTGAVIGKVTASGKVVEYNNAASDGSEVAAGVLLFAVDATSADTKGVAIVRDAIVSDVGITWKSGASAGDKTAGTADLKALGVLVRKGA